MVNKIIRNLLRAVGINGLLDASKLLNRTKNWDQLNIEIQP